jgi:ArsR family transcriptional regulator
VKKKNKIATCKVEVFDKDKIEKVIAILPTSEELLEVADTYKVLGDPTRLKIVLALAAEELCVCDLSVLVGISISGISHQLRLLRGNRIVKYRREGKMAYYSLDDEHIGNIITEVLNHVKECNNE